MNELQVAIETLETLQKVQLNYLLAGFFCFICGLIASIILTYQDKNFNISITPLVLGAVIFTVLMIIDVSMENQASELVTKIDRLKKEIYVNMSCEDLRINIVEQLRTSNTTYIKFQQDYYFASCETPLRVEVLKLQK